MASGDYFGFLGSVLDFLPKSDKDRMAELWQGYEQVTANVYQKFYERALDVSIANIQAFATERWLKYTFNSSNAVLRAASYTSSQDISAGANLSIKRYIKLSYNGHPPIEIDLQGVNPFKTTITEIVNKINIAFGFTIATTSFEGTEITLTSPIKGPTSKLTFFPASIPSQDAAELVLGLNLASLPISIPEFPYPYTLPYRNIVDIPELRDHIRDESQTINLVSGTDFTIESSGIIAFRTMPLETLWAKRTLFDEEDPWNNFGFLMDIYQKNSLDYVAVLQGLWFAFWNGPRPAFIRSALYLLFGLPVSQEVSTVTEVTATNIQTTSPDGIVRNFTIPADLVAIVSVGDVLTRFQPLVNGIDVFDKINKPGFVTTEVGRAGIQRFLTENASKGPGDTDETKALTMLEEHTFLPQIQVDAFIRPNINIANVKTFLNEIQPLIKAYLFQIIVGNFSETITVSDPIALHIGADVTPNIDSNQTTFTDQTTLDNYEASPNVALDLDSEVMLLRESVQVDVYSFASLIDSFIA